MRNECNCWSDFYKYVKRQKENREIIPVIKDHNGTIIADINIKAFILNSYYAYVFCCNRNIPELKLAKSTETFIIRNKDIRKNLKILEKQISRARWNSW